MIKHGNRSRRARCGSADVLPRSASSSSVPPAGAPRRLLDTVGLAFLFAPAYHPALRGGAGAPRARVRTVFNLVGPLTNPAGARRQLLGVYARDRVA